MKFIAFGICILFINACGESNDKNAGQLINNAETDLKTEQVNLKTSRKELFAVADSSNLTILDFKNGLIQESIFFGEPFHDSKPFFILSNSEIGCYVIKYDRYEDFVKHPDSKVSGYTLAQVYVYRPISKIAWTLNDSTEKIYSFKIFRPDIDIHGIPRIGVEKSDLIDQIGQADIDHDSILTYSELKEKYTLNFIFRFNSDTLITIDFKKSRK